MVNGIKHVSALQDAGTNNVTRILSFLMTEGLWKYRKESGFRF